MIKYLEYRKQLAYNRLYRRDKMRVKANYTIDGELKKNFDKVAKENALNKSQWLQIKMEEYIKEVERNAKK